MMGGVGFVFLYVAGTIVVLALLAHRSRRDIQTERKNGVVGFTSLDALEWKDWTVSMGWPPSTCSAGCRDFHRDDWWWWYLNKACWPGCAELHRDDWWRAFVDQVDSAAGTLTPARSVLEDGVQVVGDGSVDLGH